MDNVADKRTALGELEAGMRAARLPLGTNLVFGEGDPDAKVMFIGEAPGREEDIQIRPFVGRGGQLLRECLRDAGFKEAEVYITNIVKRRPPENRDPLPEEIEAYKPYLTSQIDIIAPPVIVTLGRFAMNYFLPTAKITKDQGKIFRVGGRCIVPMLHPAAALRAPEMMRLFRETFSKLPKIVEKCESLSRETPPPAPPRAAKLF
jgi:DNA polymerase